MENLSTFCSCTNLACPLHPTKHDKGCAPCIQKNLRLKEMPNCFFNLVEIRFAEVKPVSRMPPKGCFLSVRLS